MIRLTNLADYAVVVMTAAARCPDAKLTAPEVARATAIAAPTVAKLMGTLARAGLLEATRGVGGGFRLARRPADITIAAIIEAVDGPIALTQCQSMGLHGTETVRAGECSIESSCSVRGHWGPINRAVRDALSAVSLADLTRPAAPFGVAIAPAARELVA